MTTTRWSRVLAALVLIASIVACGGSGGTGAAADGGATGASGGGGASGGSGGGSSGSGGSSGGASGGSSTSTPPNVSSIGQGLTPADFETGLSGPQKIPFSTLASCVPQAGGRDFAINGPGSALKKLADVDWKSLKAADTVRIYYNGGTPYREKIRITASGSAGQPLKICGVPGPNGELPQINGNGATTPPSAGAGILDDFAIINIWNGFAGKPHHITIEGLDIRDSILPGSPGGVNDGSPFTTETGQKKKFASFSACIRVQHGDDIVIRGNQLSNCGNGVFVLSRDGENDVSRRLLLEGNYIHGHGIVNNYLEHNAYVQAVGVIVQYNYFGAPRPNAAGSTYKDRSIGLTLRYNYFEDGARTIDLVGVEDYHSMLPKHALPAIIKRAHDDKLMLDVPVPTKAQLDAMPMDQAADEFARRNEQYYHDRDAPNTPFTWSPMPAAYKATLQQADDLYKNTYIYGNVFRNKTALALVHFGGDKYYYDLTRAGTLHFYHNTVQLNGTNPSGGFGEFEMFDQMCRGDPPCDAVGKVVATNNVFDSIVVAPSTKPLGIAFTRGKHEVVDVTTKNWAPAHADVRVATFWNQNGGTVTGLSQLIRGTSPQFAAGGSFVPNAPDIVDQAAPLPAAIAAFPPKYQIDASTRTVSPRVINGAAADIGAVEK